MKAEVRELKRANEILLAASSSSRGNSPHPRAAVRNIVLLCSALATWYRPEGDNTPVQIAAEQVRLALGMVEASELQG